MAAIRATTKREVLQRAVDLLKTSNDYYKSRVFVMAGAELPPNIVDQDLLTVSISGGQFSYSEQAGGGQYQVPYQGTMQVSLWHTSRTDRQGVDYDALMASRTGLFSMETDVLRAMLGTLLQGTVTYDPILTQCMYAISDTEASRASDGVFGKLPSGDMAQAILTISLGVDFYWDMTADDNR